VTIVPLRIENILPTESFKYFLGNIHWLDALTPPLEKHLQEVAAKVKAILSTESVSPPEASQPSLPAKAPTVQQPCSAKRLARDRWDHCGSDSYVSAFIFLEMEDNCAARTGPIGSDQWNG
jgi:hypothetical protein